MRQRGRSSSSTAAWYRCDALDEVVRFAELTGSRVYQNWMSDVGNFPSATLSIIGDLDPSSPPAKAVFKDADVLIGIGCCMFSQGFFNPEPTLPPVSESSRSIENPWEIGKNFPVDCGIQGDIKAVLAELNASIEDGIVSRRTARKQKEESKEIGREKSKLEHQLSESGSKAKEIACPISISRLMTEIRGRSAPDTVIVDECWSASGHVEAGS